MYFYFVIAVYTIVLYVYIHYQSVKMQTTLPGFFFGECKITQFKIYIIFKIIQFNNQVSNCHFAKFQLEIELVQILIISYGMRVFKIFKPLKKNNLT